NGGWIVREALGQLAELGLWESAETFIRKYRNTGSLQQWEAQDFDRTIADFYINKQQFTSIIDEVLKKDSFKGRDLDLVKIIAQQYQQGSQSAKRRDFLEKVCAADPKNLELAFQLAELYDVSVDGEKKLTVNQRLVEE